MRSLHACAARPPGMPIADIRAYLTAGGDAMEDADALVRAHGLPLDERDWDSHTVPLDACWRIFSAHAAKVGDEAHGLFGDRLRPGATTLIVARMALCATVADALVAYKAASELMLPRLGVSVSRRAGGAIAVKWRCEQASLGHLIALEGQAVVYHAILSWLVGARLPVERVRAPAARRTATSSVLDALRAPIGFSGDDLEVVFSAASAQAPIVRRAIDGWQDGAYERLCLASAADEVAHVEGDFTRKVRAEMMRGVDQKGLAQAWGMSAKTIARRLEQEGQSFRQVRDDVRMQKATPLIHAGLSIEAISDLLGYEDCRSFRRAFKRWFGLTPSAYREQMAPAR